MKLLEFSKNITFRIDLFIWSRCDSHSYHEYYCLFTRNCLRRRLMQISAEFVAENSSLLCFLLIVYCLWKFPLYDAKLTQDSQIIHLLYRLQSQFLQSQHLFCWNNMSFMKFKYDSVCCIDSSRRRNINDTMYLDWLFVSFVKCEFSIVLILNDIVFMQSRSRSKNFSSNRCLFLLKSACDLLLRMLWYFDFWCSELKARRSKSLLWHCFFKYDLNVENSFCMNALTSCADFFNRFDVFDLSWLLWIIESLKKLTFVIENRMIECFEITCCMFVMLK